MKFLGTCSARPPPKDGKTRTLACNKVTSYLLANTTSYKHFFL